MKRSLCLVPFLVVLSLFSACGKKGPLSPPLLRIPQSVENLSLSQRGEKFVLSWTNPSAYVDGSPMKDVSEVEIWLAEGKGKEAGQAEIGRQEFEKRANLVVRIPSQKFSLLREGGKETSRLSFIYRPDKGISPQQAYTFALRVKDEKRRVSEFSVPLSVEGQALPSPPLNVRATVLESYILLGWDAPLSGVSQPALLEVRGYNVFRSSGEEPARPVNSSLIKETEYRDTDFSFGQVYRYFVRAVVSEDSPILESDDSETVEVQALDTFPTASPSGLDAIAGVTYIALSWEANTEADIAGYRVWRQEAGGTEFTLIARVDQTANSYIDTAVEKNKRYDYAITAVDGSGNESQRSEPVSTIIRYEPR